MEFEKIELEELLLTLGAYNKDNGGLVKGFLMEDLPLKEKRKAQKIQKQAQKLYSDFREEFKVVQDNCKLSEKDGKIEFDQEKLKKEIEILFHEKVKIEADYMDLALIEGIKTTNNYNFEIVEKIAK